MDTASLIVTIAAALWVGFSGLATLTGASWVADNLADYGVPKSWWPWLGTAKAAGAVGLLVGLMVPAVGVVATTGLVLYFLGAFITVIRAQSYTHLPYPLLYLFPVVAAATWATSPCNPERGCPHGPAPVPVAPDGGSRRHLTMRYRR